MELGAGRGGGSRHFAMELKAKGLLKQYTAGNICARENELNQLKAQELGLTDEVFQVKWMNFDMLDAEDDESYDVIFASDCFLHSKCKSTLALNLARILAKGGVIVFTDIIEKEDACPQMLQGIYHRLHLSSLGTASTYGRDFTNAGLTKESITFPTEQLIGHYSKVKYLAMTEKRE